MKIENIAACEPERSHRRREPIRREPKTLLRVVGLSASLALLCELDYFAAPVATVRFGAAAIETALNLENGGEIVLDYVDHNEARVAFEHLLYMIDEPPLVVS